MSPYRWMIPFVTAACAAKTAPAPDPLETVPEEAVEETEERVQEAEERMQEAAPEPSAEPNLDVQMTIVFADGTEVSGHAVRVERSEGWYAEKGWTDRPLKLTLPLQEPGTEVEVGWPDVRRIEVSYGGPRDVNCSYDGSFEPILYMCELNTTAQVTTADGKTRPLAGRHPWRISFEDGRQEAFWLYKVPLRRQPETTGAALSDASFETALRDELLAKREGRVPVTITVAPPE